KSFSEEITNPSATANAWDWVIEFLADLEHVDATFLDDLLSNVPHGYNSLSNNAKDKVVLKRLEKMIATPTTPRAALTYAARRRMLIAAPISFAINPSEPARDFYDRLMSKRGLDTSNFQDNVKVCIRQFILQKRAGLPKCALPKAEVLVECRQVSAKRPNVTGTNSAKVKKVRFADEGPTVYPVGSAINSSNHCTRVNEITPRVSEKLIENIQEAPSEDIIVSGKRKRNEFSKDQLIDLDDAETMLVERNLDHPGLFTLEVPSGGSLSPKQDEGTDLIKEHVVCKRMKKSINDGQTEQCGSGITCNNNSIPQEVLFDGLHGKISVDESINGSGNQTNPETSTGNGEIFNKAHLSCADEVLEIATSNEQNSPMTLVQDSPETDSTKVHQCIRCQKDDQLLICNTCSLVIHENCLGCPASFDGTRKFICPVCLRFQARIALEEVKKKFELAKKKFALASDYLVKFINKELVHEKIVPSETLGGLNDSNMVVNGKFHDGIDANGKQKGIVKNQAIVAQVHQQQAEIGIVHDKTPQAVPCASPISGRDIASIPEGIQPKQVNNRVDGRVVKTQSSLELSSKQGHGNLNEREKITNIHVETSDASNLQQSVNAPKSASSSLSVIANIQYETVSSGEKHANVGKKNADLRELPVNAPNGPSPVLGPETVLSNQVVCLAPNVCAEAVVTDQGLADVGAVNAVEKQQAGTSPRRPSPPLEKNMENKAENENGDGCFEFKRRHSPRKSSQQSVILPHRPMSPSNENVEEVSGNGKGDESESKKPAKRNSKRTCARRKKTVWTPEEEEILKKGVHLYKNGDGRNTPWQQILEYGHDVFQKCRLPTDLKDKWRTMLKSTGSNVV
ncbi:SANT/Myb domain, partial [Thalictrum thalictroides]